MASRQQALKSTNPRSPHFSTTPAEVKNRSKLPNPQIRTRDVRNCLLKKYLFALLSLSLLAAPLSLFADTMTPMQTAARQLQSDLNQALEQSSFNARQRYYISQDAAGLVKAADRRANGKRINRRELRTDARELLQAFDSGSFQVGDVSTLNYDFNQFKKSIR